ncbi:hypothetical protein GGX14DRAFT_560601 [Mycena pura]|uniref:Uncharacterized protein n=1 Tax=Mycena pura TaxID=153505 RepID=A0AAD6YII0_9AGAR|nr:hypothetical protein GGX14DRAFT_560601 [Mycena pura]
MSSSGSTSESTDSDSQSRASESTSSSSSGASGWASGFLGQMSDDSGSDAASDLETRPPILRRWIQREIDTMYDNRYEAPRTALPRGPSYLHYVLTTFKSGRPDHFRQALRIGPETFDALLITIQQDSVFANNSNNAQLPVDQQLAVALYRFGHDGNGASLQSVANWAGLGKGTIHLITRRVLTAILRPDFVRSAVRLPTEEEKE